MLTRRHLLLTSAATALVVSAPAVAVALPSPTSAAVISDTDKAIHLLRSLGYDHWGMVGAFGLRDYAPRNEADLRYAIMYCRDTLDNANMRSRVRILASVCDAMDRKYGGSENLRKYLVYKGFMPDELGKGFNPDKRGLDYLGSGHVPNLEVVAFYICG